MPKSQRFETQWGGKTLSIEVGKYANQASGSCMIQYGETVLLATATMSQNKRENLHFFPLTVDFEEKLYAAGRIKGSRFMKRTGRPTDEAVLTARFIDRALRPLFDDSIRNDIQIIISALAFDQENDPDIIGLIGASCALHISDIPWNGPIGAVRVSKLDDQYVLNPTYEQRDQSTLDLSFAGTSDKIIMVEAGANEATEQVVLDGFWFGQKEITPVIKLIEQVKKAVGKEKADLLAPKTDEEKEALKEQERVEALAHPFIIEQTKELLFNTPQATKSDRVAQRGEITERLKTHLVEQGVDEENLHYGTKLVYETIEEEVSRAIAEDGRGLTEIRDLVSEVTLLPRVHGSGHFMRGETQVLTITTLGSPGDEQTLDGMEVIGTKRYFHHYNFPPFSVGEVKPLRGPSRRDIGHGGLAEKALAPMMPDKESFPYTVWTMSEIFGSNGSSSMGATCGSTLALMDAGVPIKEPVAGLAMGLAMSGDKWKVITDLQDLEDGKGGMDFKIAGSKNGITAIQMDTKTHGLSKEIVEQTFAQAKDARLEILDVILKAIPEPRAELSEHAPRIITLRIKPELIGNVIGPGGKMINEIIELTNVQAIDIEDDGLVMITSTDAAGAAKAKEMVESLTREVEVGQIYKGKVTRIMDFGAIVEFLPKQDGMVHVSMMAPWRVEKVTNIVKLGQEVMVKVMEHSPEGRTSLSMKDAPGNEYPDKPKQSEGPRGPRGNDRPRKPFIRKPYPPKKD